MHHQQNKGPDHVIAGESSLETNEETAILTQRTSAMELAPWLVVAALTAALTATTTIQALSRYEALESGWSWDVAYYNQWFWAMTKGDGIISVRPIASFATEGPSVWKTNYLAPIRFLLLPIYALFPDPRTLLVFQNVIFWWVIPAAYTLALAESRSRLLAVSAAVLVPLVPLFWPLVWNDFRELQLAAPFVLWAVQGVRGRSPGLAAVGIAGMVACRQEFALMVASFAIIAPREPERLAVTLQWRRALVLGGLGWLLVGFFGHLKYMVGPGAPNAFIEQFGGPSASILETMSTASEALLTGLGGWAVLALLAPRMALLALPWIWSLCNGRWALRMIDGASWHHVRYTMPMVATVLAAGLVGYARIGRIALANRYGWIAVSIIWILAGAISIAGTINVVSRMSQVPRIFTDAESRELWKWIRQVGPDDAVLADYAVCGPLSSRKRLYSYVMDQNLPKNFPDLDSDFKWLFVRNGYPPLKLLLGRGFEIVAQGKFLTVARR